MTARLAVLVSGGGSNFRAVVRAIDEGQCDASIVLVLSDREGIGALDFARERSLPTRVLRLNDFPSRETWNDAIASTLSEAEPDLVVLAGFMKVLGASVTRRYPERIVNVHPALLPAFPGTDAPAQAIAAGVSKSGCTVHFVDEGVDTGRIIAQAEVPVLSGDSPETLHRRIQEQEWILFPRVIAELSAKVGSW